MSTSTYTMELPAHLHERGHRTPDRRRHDLSFLNDWGNDSNAYSVMLAAPVPRNSEHGVFKSMSGSMVADVRSLRHASLSEHVVRTAL